MTLRIVLLLVALAGALAVHTVWGLPVGFSFLIFFVGWPLVGTLITADDDLPGGFSNPTGDIRPPWQTAFFWGQALVGLAISFAAFAVGSRWHSFAAALYWLAAFALRLSLHNS